MPIFTFLFYSCDWEELPGGVGLERVGLAAGLDPGSPQIAGRTYRNNCVIFLVLDYCVNTIVQQVS